MSRSPRAPRKRGKRGKRRPSGVPRVIDVEAELGVHTGVKTELSGRGETRPFGRAALHDAHQGQVCTYCLRSGPLTRDHVPPKLLFPKPRPDNLVTVPSCDSCNNSAMLDDEYFRRVISLREGAGDHPDAEQVGKRVLDGLIDPKKKGFLESFRRDIQEGQKTHPRGYSVDNFRLLRVASRCVRGLFFKETGRRLPSDYVANALVDEMLPRQPENVQRVAKRIEHLLDQDVRRIGTVFTYSYRLFDEDPYASVFALRFYGDTFFGVITCPRAGFSPGLAPGWFPYENTK